MNSKAENILKNRKEILFLYDVKFGNPNGDPLDENKPRIDEETGINFVTDVRLKRTIRDYLASKGFEIFVSGEAVTSEERAKALLGENAKADKAEVQKKLCEKCIDIRLFGGTIPLKLRGRGEGGEGLSITGPVQFRFGRSLHRVKVEFVKGTAAFASGAGKEQRSFREEWILPYSLIAFYGVVNQNAAKDTGLTEEDVQELLEAMWVGTKNLITRSKMEQNPRILIAVTYKEGINLHIGELDAYVELEKSIPDEKIRDISEVKLNLTKLVNALAERKDKIEKVEVAVDPRVRTTPEEVAKSLENEGITVENLFFE